MNICLFLNINIINLPIIFVFFNSKQILSSSPFDRWKNSLSAAAILWSLVKTYSLFCSYDSEDLDFLSSNLIWFWLLINESIRSIYLQSFTCNDLNKNMWSITNYLVQLTVTFYLDSYHFSFENFKYFFCKFCFKSLFDKFNNINLIGN